MIDMVCAADIAEKAVGVEVYDVRGICPQHMTLLAIFGDTSSAVSYTHLLIQKLMAK